VSRTGFLDFCSGVERRSFRLSKSWIGKPPLCEWREQQNYYRAQKQACFAPPARAFFPAWTINNLFAIWGLLRALHKERNTPGRSEYLALQAMSWIDFVSFGAAYFGLRSPLNALS
jgi:tryptophan-rich sensory protein